MEYLNVESHFNEWRELINHLKATSNLSINDHDLIALICFKISIYIIIGAYSLFAQLLAYGSRKRRVRGVKQNRELFKENLLHTKSLF